MKKTLKFTIIIVVLALFANRPHSAISGYQEDMDAQIKKLNDQISSSKQKIQDIQNKQKQYLDLINQKQAEQNTLSNELGILGDQVDKAQADIDENQLEIDRTNLEINKTTIDIQDTEDSIDQEKTHIAALLRSLYKQDQISTLEILLLNNSLTDFISQVKYLQNTNDEVVKSVEDLKSAKDKLDQNKQTLLQKQDELAKLEQTLEDKKAKLEDTQQSKNYILETSRQSEKNYQYMLTQERAQEAKTDAEITSLAKTVQNKLNSMKNKPALNYSGFIWPVTKNTITTYFHDPDYPFRKLIGEHPGWDIRSPYGSQIKAAADGYVARETFDGSKNYAYIMIIHANGLSTVYGHVSGVYVKADDYVVQGQVIGRSGGLPGSPGSGPFTTGPHLHFEIRLNGIPVDPQDYLQ